MIHAWRSGRSRTAVAAIVREVRELTGQVASDRVTWKGSETSADLLGTTSDREWHAELHVLPRRGGVRLQLDPLGGDAQQVRGVARHLLRFGVVAAARDAAAQDQPPVVECVERACCQMHSPALQEVRSVVSSAR